MPDVFILSVDDTTSIVSPWKNLLADYATLINVVGGFEATAKLRDNVEIKLVIVNLSLGHINGLESIEKIRKVNPKIPIVVLAKKEDAKLVKEATNYSIHGFEWIPFKPEAFLEKIKKIIPLTKTQTQASNSQASETITETPQDIKQLYYEGQSALLNNDLDKAIEIFTKISQEKKLKDSYLKYVNEAFFQLGRCWLNKGNPPKSIETFSAFLSRTSDSLLTRKALFSIGDAYEALNKPDKAVNFYKKVISLEEFDSLSSQARKKIKKLG